MSSGVPINSARRTKSYAAAAVVDADGVKTTFATVAAPVVLTGADWNGAAIVTVTGLLDLPRSITISRSSAANQYSVNPIVLTGMRGGVQVTESIAQPNDDGNDTLRGVQAFDYLTRVDIPTNAGTGGAYTIGVQDICSPKGQSFTQVKMHAAGTLNVKYGEDSTSTTDAIPCVDGALVETIAPTRILTSAALSAPTTTGLTLYLP